MAEDNKIVAQRLAEERLQSHSTRKDLYVKLQKEFELPVVSFFTSFRYPVMIEDNDVDMLEGVLQKCCLDKGFVLLINSPGGDGLAAERIINICRSYSGTKGYTAIVPGKAKSAATMICFGASKIIMGDSSELGAVDPQIVIQEDKGHKWFSVFNVVQSYKQLFARAVKEKGNLQPYLQQLANYDEREIAEFELALRLSEDIAIKALKSGMLSKYSSSQIRRRIKSFLTPEEVKTHGRPIYAVEAKKCGLNVEFADIRSSKWSLVYELYVRLSSYVSHENVAKCIECEEYSFRATAPAGNED